LACGSDRIDAPVARHSASECGTRADPTVTLEEVPGVAETEDAVAPLTRDLDPGAARWRPAEGDDPGRRHCALLPGGSAAVGMNETRMTSARKSG